MKSPLKILFFFGFLLFLKSSAQNCEAELVVLGTVKNFGSPQMGCKKDCRKDLLPILMKLEKWFLWG